MGKERRKEDVVLCPVGRFFSDLEGSFGSDSPFFMHMKESRVEFLKAIRSLVDERIDSLEKQGSGRKKKGSTRIKVE